MRVKQLASISSALLQNDSQSEWLQAADNLAGVVCVPRFQISTSRDAYGIQPCSTTYYLRDRQYSTYFLRSLEVPCGHYQIG